MPVTLADAKVLLPLASKDRVLENALLAMEALKAEEMVLAAEVALSMPTCCVSKVIV